MIKHANHNHLYEIVDVIRESILSCTLDHNNDARIIEEWLSNKTEENVSNWIVNNISFVYLYYGKVVGFICLSLNGVLLLNYISPSHQKKGFGRELLNYLINYCKLNNISHIYLESTLTALTFYKKNGFKVVNDIAEDGVVVGFVMIFDFYD